MVKAKEDRPSPKIPSGYHLFDGVLRPRVTAITSRSVAKDWLTSWYAKLAATRAVTDIVAVAAMAEEDAIDFIARAAKEEGAFSRAVGSVTHKAIDIWLHNEALSPAGAIAAAMAAVEEIDRLRVAARPGGGEMVLGCFRAFERFICDHSFGEAVSEVQIINETDDWAGTADWICQMPMIGIVLIDWKTGSTMPLETIWQLNAYAHGTSTIHQMTGEKNPMPKIDEAWAVRLRPDGYGVYKIPITDTVYGEFLRMRANFEGLRRSTKNAWTEITPISEIERMVSEMDSDPFLVEAASEAASEAAA